MTLTVARPMFQASLHVFCCPLSSLRNDLQEERRPSARRCYTALPQSCAWTSNHRGGQSMTVTCIASTVPLGDCRLSYLDPIAWAPGICYPSLCAYAHCPSLRGECVALPLAALMPEVHLLLAVCSSRRAPLPRFMCGFAFILAFA